MSPFRALLDLGVPRGLSVCSLPPSLLLSTLCDTLKTHSAAGGRDEGSEEDERTGECRRHEERKKWQKSEGGRSTLPFQRATSFRGRIGRLITSLWLNKKKGSVK
ncbi:unnamed protein product [Pleuronectes platessa]|uniref:Uncharacterized protein n=1 Tax=Pleuronectes platessa TaxID=8262 RepID=A0A9N7TYQ2_PLEPL|nr:unnamed protein product [Pleuronectes platessa]